ncbi:MAG: peptidylprolyl isomerase [Opitutaceae bacterium]|nr:peptidylprolyl isomerase [Opitutaceae bacterium]
MRSTTRAGLLLSCSVLFALSTWAQATLPTVTVPLPTVTTTVGATGSTIDLKGHFGLAGVTNQIVQFNTTMGTFNLEVLPAAAPASVLNFLGYVGRGAYTNTIIHRSVPGFVIQGGGFALTGTTLDAIPTVAPIALEYNLPNTRGTLSMARTDSLNSATSQWFVNTVDNTTTLGTSNNGGYAVFARVLGTGMTVVDGIAALTVYNASAALNSATYTQLPLRGPDLTIDNLVIVNSARTAYVMPDGSTTPAVLTLTASSSNPAVATAAIAASTLTVTPVGGGTCTITVRATDTNGNLVEATSAVAVSARPAIATHPASQNVAANGSALLSVTPLGSTGGFSYRWFRNGIAIDGATNSSLQLTNVQSAQAGLYDVEVTAGANTTRSRPAVIGVVPAAGTQTAGAITTRAEWQSIHHPNGNIYDQFLLTGASGTITTTGGKIARVSLLDEQNNIVQFEMSGPGSLTVVLTNPSGPKAPALYNQAGVEYMQGTPTVVLAGADASTHMSIYSVGTKTNPGVTRTDVVYNGWANVCAVGIQSTTGGLGGLYYGNVLFASAAGPAGIVAPSLRTIGTLNFHELTTTAAGEPMILLAPEGQAKIKITGGSLAQPAGIGIDVSGLDTVQMVAGEDSCGRPAPAQANQGRLYYEGIDITAELIVGP